MFNFATFSLNSSRSVVLTSAHGGKFSDGTEVVLTADQKAAITAAFAAFSVALSDGKVLSRLPAGEGCAFNRSRLAPISFRDEVAAMVLADNLQQHCAELGAVAWVSLPCRQALNVLAAKLDDGREWPNLCAMRSTPETARSAPQDKIVDLDGWTL